MPAHRPDPKEDKEIAAARKEAEAKTKESIDAAQDAAKAQTEAAEAAEAADTARFAAESAKAEMVQTVKEKNAAASAPPAVVAAAFPNKDDYEEFTIMHTIVELPNGDIKHRGDQVTTKDLRGTGTKAEQDAREQRYIDAGAVAKTGEVKFRPN